MMAKSALCGGEIVTSASICQEYNSFSAQALMIINRDKEKNHRAEFVQSEML
jgi:hypothetical protein